MFVLSIQAYSLRPWINLKRTCYEYNQSILYICIGGHFDSTDKISFLVAYICTNYTQCNITWKGWGHVPKNLEIEMNHHILDCMICPCISKNNIKYWVKVYRFQAKRSSNKGINEMLNFFLLFLILSLARRFLSNQSKIGMKGRLLMWQKKALHFHLKVWWLYSLRIPS
jgi:hypothetical protein